jgi:hypothetical protein
MTPQEDARDSVDVLREIEAHHVEQNRLKGRDESRSKTLRLVREAIAALSSPSGAVAWTVVGPDGKSSIGGWMDMRVHEASLRWAVLREGHRYAYAYTRPQPAEPVEGEVIRGEATGDTPTFAETWAKLTALDRAIISSHLLETRASPIATPAPVSPLPAVGDEMVPASSLNDLCTAYVRLLETGRDRIRDLGGECDPVDVMERGDIDLRKARSYLAALRKHHGGYMWRDATADKAPYIDDSEAKNAARYRRLRDCHAFGPVAVLSAAQNHKLLEGMFLDAAIDAALTPPAKESP